jgi:ATP-dependent DNA ligase
MRLLRIPELFDHPDFIFEPTIEAFRALAYIERHQCRLVSRNGYVFRSWPQLAEELAHAVHAKSAILDGEICSLDADWRSNFNALLFRREWPYFCDSTAALPVVRNLAL